MAKEHWLFKDLAEPERAEFEYVVKIRTVRKISDEEAERFVVVPHEVWGWHPEGSIEWSKPFFIEWIDSTPIGAMKEIIEGVRYALDSEVKEGLFKERSLARTTKNVVWQEIVAAWDRRGIITSDVAEKLMKMRF